MDVRLESPVMSEYSLEVVHFCGDIVELPGHPFIFSDFCIVIPDVACIYSVGLHSCMELRTESLLTASSRTVKITPMLQFSLMLNSDDGIPFPSVIGNYDEFAFHFHNAN